MRFFEGRVVKIGLLLLVLCLGLTACYPAGGPTQDPDTTEAATQNNTPAGYTVTVTDHFGNPISGIVVQLMQDGEFDSMSVTGADGNATFKKSSGEYRVALDFAGGADEAAGYSYDLDAVKLTPESPNATVVLYRRVTAFETLLKGVGTYEAGKISHGAYRVDLAENGTTYFIFRPTEVGIYEFGVVSGSKVEIGYYGDPLNVTDYSIAEVSNGKIRLEIRSMFIGESEETTTPYVIGLTPRSAKSCILTVEKVGMPEKSPAEDTWREIRATEKYLVDPKPISGSFTPLELKSAGLTVVLNESDGYYHLGTADGPVVYVLIKEPSSYADLLPSFIAQLDTSALGVYFYDENGKYLYKELYNELFTAYAAVCNADGATPLTEELAQAIKNLGDFRGWWNFPDQDIFGDTLVPVEVAWLFACGYYK